MDNLRLFNGTSVSIILTFIIIWTHYYYKNLFKYWTNKGLAGPKPVPVFGNLLEFFKSNRMETEKRWRTKYGKLYGSFMGHQPYLMVADAEILRQICVRDFNSFPNHEPNAYMNYYQKHFIFFIQDEHWKRVRSVMTPTFTSSKIKRMFKLLQFSSNDLVNCFKEQIIDFTADNKLDPNGGDVPGTEINLKDVYSLFTMDAIASCCYGLKLQRSGSTSLKSAASRDDFVALGLKLFELNVGRFIALFSIPKPILKLFKFELNPRRLVDPLARRVEQIITSRRDCGRKFDDYLQILMDAKLSKNPLELNEMDSKENHHAGLTLSSIQQDQQRLLNDIQNLSSSPSTCCGQFKGPIHSLTDEEILSNAIYMLMVGLETTATLLTHSTYILAFHPDIQQRLFEEIRPLAELQDDETYNFQYDSLTSCHYLDSVISETLRLLPPVGQIDRVCSENYYIEKYKVHIEKGTKLSLAYYAIMNDPDYWPDPDRFDPERFMPGRRENIVPGSYCPFGLGPRHCLGMKFSLTETKLALAKMIVNFTFEPAPGTKFPPEPKFNFGLNEIMTPIVRISSRKS